MKLLCIPDAHAHPEYSNRRFLALGKFIVKERPDVIVCLGDFADLPSLSSYDRGTRGFEGRRYAKDIQATQAAMSALLGPICDLNKDLANKHRPRYKPRMVMLLGNHEARIDKVTNSSAELHGTIGMHDLGYENAGWEVIPYKEGLMLEGWYFTHCFHGHAGRALSSHNVKLLLDKKKVSLVVGHSHILDYATCALPGGRRLHALSAGCFIEPEMAKMDWCKDASDDYWFGVTIIDGALDGDCSRITFVDMQEVLRA